MTKKRNKNTEEIFLKTKKFLGNADNLSLVCEIQKNFVVVLK